MKLLLSLIASLALASPALTDDVASPFMSQATRHFDAWDANHDHLLSMAEIDHAIADPAVRAEAAACAVALKRGTKDKAAKLAMEDIRMGKDYGKLYAWALDRITKANRSLFSTQPPLVDSIRQGKTGDCFCLAALRTMVQRDPQVIAEMIKTQPDGTWSVKVGSRSIPVPSLTDGEIAIGSNSQNGLWPLVYEKAVGISRIKEGAADATPYNVVTRGGSAGTMMSILTGHQIKRWSCKTWRDAGADAARQAELLKDLRHQLVAAFAQKRLVTGGTAGLAPGKKGPPGITFNHGYAVLGYDPAKDELLLWNPHGDDFKPKGEDGLANGYTKTKGEFHIPLRELVTFFGGFAFEQEAPLAEAVPSSTSQTSTSPR
jgi:hypothetical protein